ncbi:flavin-containing monooxygenase [Crossiella cryophila]|uniref:Putative flavoprotein involved in K+ transport n=1 Tax=Crossiella cryophila TaxID=43355 RepID=A0A7W7FWB0_9PSEU|nr:NAD(P)/FAD-dependent oxidoreductase [Crossiella cryophila]MBB4680077.1 putative flavoprotein involved in K+ transport [Crossiella cryophila]
MTLHDAIVIGGGQSGLAAAHALRARGARPLLLEAADRPVGSWPGYYDSLTLFSPARYSALPGLPFGGDPERYPHRDEVVDYLARYATRLDIDLRIGTRVTGVTTDGPHLLVRTAAGAELHTRTLVAATGAFGRPHRPDLPGLDTFTGTLCHVADYREPLAYQGKRVIVVGAGNSAVQIAAELAEHATVTLASRIPVKFTNQRPLGKDLHFWFHHTRIDRLPIGRFFPPNFTQPVLDHGPYRAALAAGRPDRRDLFTDVNGSTVTWADGREEHVDVIILATGYRPDLPYLGPLGALDGDQRPLHRAGLSTVHPRLGFAGLELQRSPASASLRGVGTDARYVVTRLLRQAARGA